MTDTTPRHAAAPTGGASAVSNTDGHLRPGGGRHEARDRPDGGQGGTDHGSTKWWTLAAVCLGTFMLLLDVTILNVALPDIQTALGSSFADLQWIIDAYALTLAALLLTAGSLADIYGRRRVYVIGLILFSVASLLCGLSQNTLELQLFRGLQGVGGAIMFSVSLALLANAFRGKDRGLAFGIWGAITGIAVSVGPLLGGVLTSGLSWEWIFYVNVPIGVLAIAISLTRIAESRSQGARRPDWAGVVLFTAALGALVYGLIESNQSSFTDPVVLSCLIAAPVLLAAFVVVEARGSQPMFDLSLFRLPTFSGGLVAAFGISASLFSLLLYLVLYLQNVLGFSAFGTGVRLLVLSGGILATSIITGRLSSHVPVRFLIGPGLLLVGGGLLLMRGLDPTTTWTHLVPGLIMAGVGAGMVNPPLASTAVGVVRPQQAGMASGINSTFRQVGIATGIALLGTLFSSRIQHFVADNAASVPQLNGRIDQLDVAIQSGKIDRVLEQLPPQARAAVGELTRSAFTTSLNYILVVAAIVAFGCGVVALASIRGKDFAHQGD